jgi:hypothetical protein
VEVPRVDYDKLIGTVSQKARPRFGCGPMRLVDCSSVALRAPVEPAMRRWGRRRCANTARWNRRRNRY